jgi:hypothetical protein
MELSADRTAGFATGQMVVEEFTEAVSGAMMFFGYALALYYAVFDPRRKNLFGYSLSEYYAHPFVRHLITLQGVDDGLSTLQEEFPEDLAEFEKRGWSHCISALGWLSVEHNNGNLVHAMGGAVPGGPYVNVLELEVGFCRSLEHVASNILAQTLAQLNKPDRLLDLMVYLESAAEQAEPKENLGFEEWEAFKASQLSRNKTQT